MLRHRQYTAPSLRQILRRMTPEWKDIVDAAISSIECPMGNSQRAPNSKSRDVQTFQALVPEPARLNVKQGAAAMS